MPFVPARRSIALRSGTMVAALAQDAEVFHFRWGSEGLCNVHAVKIWAGAVGTFTAGFCSFSLFCARNWTVDGSGGTAAVLTGHNGKVYTPLDDSIVPTARIASTGQAPGALVAGTKALDAQAMDSVGGGVPAVAGTPMVGPEYLWLSSDSVSPLRLENQDGLVIKAAVPSGGTWTFGVSVKWARFVP